MTPFLKGKIFYGWVITLAGFFIAFIGLGVRLSFGVFVKSIEGVFDLGRAATSSIFGVYMLLCCVFAVLGGWALDRYGPKKITFLMAAFTGLSLLLTSRATAAWHLFVTYGLLLSLGTGPVFAAVNSTASRWFVKKRGVVLGITSSASGIGVIVLAPFATYLIATYDWRTAFMVTGIVGWLVMGSMALLMIKDPADVGLLPDGAKPETSPGVGAPAKTNPGNVGLSAIQAVKSSPFWFLGLGWLFISLTLHLVYVHAVPFAVDQGIDPMDAAIIISVIGVATLIGRVLVGKVSDVIGRRIPAVVCGALQVGSLLWLIGARDLWMFHLFAATFGVFGGGLSAMTAVLIGDVFGTKSIATIMGMLGVGWALGAATGPALGGIVFDASGSYTVAFATAAAAVMLATLFIAMIRTETA